MKLIGLIFLLASIITFALYGIPWVDVVSGLRELSDLAFIDRLQNSAAPRLESGEGADQVIEGEHTVSYEPLASPAVVLQ